MLIWVSNDDLISTQVLPYIDISQLSERAPGFAKIFKEVQIKEGGKQHPANFSNQAVHEVNSASPAWGKYWNTHLRSFVAEFPDVDGFCKPTRHSIALVLHSVCIMQL